MNSLASTHPQTENTVTIVVTDVIDDTLCIASEDGQKVYDQIAAAFKQGKNVIVLIGQVVLEKLDLLVDCKNLQLIPNPAHPDYPITYIL